MWMEGFRRYRARAMPVSRSKPTHNPHLKHQATYVRCWLANTAGPESVTSYITALALRLIRLLTLGRFGV